MTRFKKVLVLGVLLLMPVLALAETIAVPDVGLPGNTGDDVESVLLLVITNLLLPIAGVVAVLFLIVGGFQYMFAGVNEDLVKKGKATIRNSLIGLVVVILSYLVVTVVVNTLFRGV